MIAAGLMNADGVSNLVAALLKSGARRATKFWSPKEVVSACRPCYKGKVHDGRDTRATVVLKLGAPNHLERRFIKSCQKAGEPFPVKKIQLKFPKGR